MLFSNPEIPEFGLSQSQDFGIDKRSGIAILTSDAHWKLRVKFRFVGSWTADVVTAPSCTTSFAFTNSSSLHSSHPSGISFFLVCLIPKPTPEGLATSCHTRLSIDLDDATDRSTQDGDDVPPRL